MSEDILHFMVADQCRLQFQGLKDSKLVKFVPVKVTSVAD